ncbi:hypothetical protein FGG08_005313 [Glutinoglossum americanum]|uniref:Pentatricopeptide repeat-containing protein n=1 Tax=Glutinoglossum americanum TaxID=1670608 RepID=A0A9P8L1I5_9PEZI|nr:hypothetical protein FGG08_005313 [Glutinoglossum americanum]
MEPWWTSMLEGEDSGDGHQLDNVTERRRQRVSANPFSGFLLEFLYPSGALALIRQFTSYGLGKWESPASRHDIFSRGKRSYMSSTCRSDVELGSQVSEVVHLESPSDSHHIRTTGNADADQIALSPVAAATSSFPKHTSSLKALHDLLQKPLLASRNNKLWRLYIKCLGLADTDQLALPLLERLSYSRHQRDAERAVQLFHDIPFHKRAAVHYRLVVKAYLSLQDVQQALNCVKESSERGMANSGEHRLLAYAVDKGLWDLGLETWKLHFDETNTSARNHRLWRLARALPNIWGQALTLAKYTKTQFDQIQDTLDSDRALSLLKFIRSLVLGSLLTRHISVKEEEILSLFDALKPLKLRKPAMYNRAIMGLIRSGSDKAAGRLYRHLRGVEHTTPSQKTMHSIFRVFCSFRDVHGMQMLLDDWFRYYQAPSRSAYEMTMAAFAAQGNAQMVDEIFTLFLSRFGRPKTLIPLTSLLSVHARRGDVGETANQFKRIAGGFKLKPDVACWNVLLSAHARQDDVEGVRRCFDEMKGDGIRPDEYTIGTLLGFCANRGDIEGAEDMYRLSEHLELKKTTVMIGSLVLAYINDGQLGRAETLVKKFSTTDLEGPPTRMWNHILTAFASRRDGDGISRTLQRMQLLEVPLDGMTYSALMQFLVNIGQVTAAYRILKEVMPREGIRATAFHYSIIMEGFAKQGDLGAAFGVLQRMTKRNIRPTISTHIVLLKATASADLTEFKARPAEYGSLKLAGAENVLDELLLDADASQMAVNEPIKGIKGQLLPAVYPAAFFDFIIFLYGREGFSEKALDLYDRYLIAAKKENPYPLHTIKLIAALMATHLQGGRYVEVAQYWGLAMKIARRQTARLNLADSSTPNQVPSSRKYLLTTPFRHHAKSLSEQGKIDELITLVEFLNQNGFELENCSWNLSIQLLALNRRTLLAFELCETHLMRNWAGWRLQLREKGMTNRQIKRLPKSPMRPSYTTISHLAEVFLETSHSKRTGSEDAKNLIANLKLKCPKTINAVQNLPGSEIDLGRGISG